PRFPIAAKQDSSSADQAVVLSVGSPAHADYPPMATIVRCLSTGAVNPDATFRPAARRNTSCTALTGSAANSAGFRSNSRSWRRQGLSIPSEVTRMRLHAEQNGSDTGLMNPMRPGQPGTLNRRAGALGSVATDSKGPWAASAAALISLPGTNRESYVPNAALSRCMYSM